MRILKKINYFLLTISILNLTTYSYASKIYYVKKGDTLKSIAKKYKINVKTLLKYNKIKNPDSLKIGYPLNIPEKELKSVKNPILRQKDIGYTNGTDVNLRSGPGTKYKVLGKIKYKGEKIIILNKKNGWYKVITSNKKQGWIAGYLVKIKKKIKPKKKKLASLASKEIKQKSIPVSSVEQDKSKISSFGEKIVKTALRYKGSRYRWGGITSRGFDCSGFVLNVFRQYGINLPHSTKALYQKGVPVKAGELKPGDLVFFHTTRPGISHVGIYVGNGMFIHSSSLRSRGVRVDSLSNGYYKRRFIGARRIIKQK
jgi:cell wall-associated NlpC family hydrolase